MSVAAARDDDSGGRQGEKRGHALSSPVVGKGGGAAAATARGAPGAPDSPGPGHGGKSRERNNAPSSGRFVADGETAAFEHKWREHTGFPDSAGRRYSSVRARRALLLLRDRFQHRKGEENARL